MIEKERKIGSSLSAKIVAFLRGQGLTLKKIGQLAGVSESFLSRVARQERGFTIDHLQRLEEGLNQPLPYLLLKATPKESIPKELRGSYKEALRLLESTDKWRMEFFGKSRVTSPKSRAAG